MSPSLKRSLLGLAGLAAACGGDGTDISAPPQQNVPPVASFANACIDLTCTFSDSSSDPDGTVINHHWTFGDGDTSDVSSPGHTYAAAGVYHAELAVTDDRGGTAGAARDVTVTTSAPSDLLAFSDSAIGFCFRPASTRSCVRLEEHVLFTSTGGKAMKWRAVSDPWILLRPASGTTPTDVTVSVDTRKLPPVGSSLSVSGLITVSVSGVSSNPQTIPVKLQFYAQPLPR